MRLLAMLGVLVTLIAVPAAAATPVLTQRVTDNADILDTSTEMALATKLAHLEKDTTAQVYVLTVSSLDGVDIESFANATLRKNGIGQKGKDNGVLLIFAPNERKARIEVGYRLEPTLTDAASKMILQNDVKPFLHKGGVDDWNGAATAATDKIIGYVRTDFAEQAQSQKPAPSTGGGGWIIFWLIVIFLVVILVIRAMVRASRREQDLWEERVREQYTPPSARAEAWPEMRTHSRVAAATAAVSSTPRSSRDDDTPRRSSDDSWSRSSSDDQQPSDNDSNGGGGSGGGGGASADL